MNTNDCVFCKILKGEILSVKVWEDKNFLAFLSINPVNPGHTLIIPKKHISYIFDMKDKDLSQILVFSKPIAQALKQAFQPSSGKIGIIVAGGEVPHVHLHLIPMENESDLRKLPQESSPDMLQKNVSKIREILF